MNTTLKLSVAMMAVVLMTPAAQAESKGKSNGGDGTSIRMVRIEPGSFTMGSYTEKDEQPPHQVRFHYAFEIGKTEVTQAQWKAIMGNNPSNFKQCGGNCPVENVSWDDAQAFIGELNAQTGKNYRLPTEAEWEYACRAGGQHEEYCGNSLAGIAWYEANSEGHTHPVATKRANAWGLYDMSGNVWEWVQDWYVGNYIEAPVTGTERTDGEHKYRVLRRGSWGDVPQDARAANRVGNDPALRLSSDGFRLARTLP